MRKTEFKEIKVEKNTLLSIVDAVLYLDVSQSHSPFSNNSVVTVTIKSLPDKGIQILNKVYNDEKTANIVVEALIAISRGLVQLRDSNIQLTEGTILYKDHKRKEVEGLYKEND